MTEQPTTPPEQPVRPMPRLGHGVHWPAIVAEIDRAEQTRRRAAEPEPTPSLGTAGSSLGVEAPVVDVTKPGFGIIGIAEARSWGIEPPPAVELLAMADDLNAHGGVDETFVAELLRQAADPYADAKRGLGIVDPPPTPVKTTEPISYEAIVEALEKIAPLGPQRLDVVKLTQEQIDAVTASQPHVSPSDESWHFFGVPVELVETVEESTPYELVNARPGGIVEFPGELSDAEFETLRADWLRAFDAKPRLSRWTVEPRARVVPFGEPFRPLADVLDEQPATEPRPWWRRTLDRVRRSL